MVSEGVGSIFRRKDDKYFIYLPKDLAEDTGFPFPMGSSSPVRISFKQGKKQIIIEPQDK